MNAVNLVLNGRYVDSKNENKTIFTHSDQDMILIHYYSKNYPSARLEFTKYRNRKEKKAFISVTFNPNFAISGTIILENDTIKKANINFSILKENSHSILETYLLTINTNGYSLDYTRCSDFLSKNIVHGEIEDKLTLDTIDEFVSMLLERIKQDQEQCSKRKIDTDHCRLSEIFAEEENILDFLKQKAYEDPKHQEEILSFIADYSSTGFPRTRKKH